MEFNTDRSAAFIGLLVAAMIFAFIWLSPSQDETASSAPISETDSVPQAQPPTEAFSESESVPEASPPAQLQAPDGTVYECVTNGQRVFSDYPCGDNARTRDTTPQNVYTAPSYPLREPTRVYRASRQVQEQTESNKEDCSRYEEAVKRIDERMRQGYTSATGEFLREEHRKAAAARDDCKRRSR